MIGEDESMWIQVTTIGDLLDRRAEISDRDALVLPGARLTYPELSALTDRFAASLLGLGVQPGDKVGILMPNGLDYVAALFATAKLGAVAVPINGRFKVHECSHVVSHSDAKVLLVGADPNGTDYPALITEVFPEIAAHESAKELDLPTAPLLRRVVDLIGSAPGFVDRAGFDAAGADVSIDQVKTLQSRVKVRDIALLMYTSGTTARPKGCLLTHEAITRQAEKVARTRFFLTEEDAFWDPLPMFHCGGIVPMIGVFSVGAKFCHAGFFEPGEALRTIEAERCTVLYPTFDLIFWAMLDHPDFDKRDLSAVRMMQNVCTPELLAQFEARMPWARQVTSYGSTECATNLTMGLQDAPYEQRIATLGPPVEGMQVLITDPETGEPMPTGRMGELCFKGYSSFEGYYKDPEGTAKAFDADGWFHSGDRAMVNEDGNLVFGGRLKDMLKVGGENVAAIEIEDYLTGHPAVAVAQVVGTPDARYGEVPVAFVQLSPGASVTEAELIDFCVGKIATYKIPRYVRVVTEWPMSGTKVQKFVLKERITAELSAAGIAEAPKIVTRQAVG
jgi:fatty-acyl-CoA synthase